MTRRSAPLSRPGRGAGGEGLLFAVCLLACDDIVDVPPAPPDPMSVACDQIARDLCAALAGCCAASGQDSSACVAGARARCEPFADDVRQGKSRYDEAAARACGGEERAVFGNCGLTVISYTLASSADLLSCERIFSTGTAAPGEPCTKDSGCAPVARAGTLTYCDTDDNLCDIIEILEEGAACTGMEGPVVELCGQDLYCLRPPGQSIGTCTAKTAIGGVCAGDAIAPCVSEAFCDGAAQTCTALKDGGETCESPVECRSLACSGGLCAPASSFFDANVCAGRDR